MTKHRITVGLAVLACALGATAVVKASIPDGSGVIHGCYKTNQGTLRVIDTALGQTCSNSETALNWNQTGPQGTPGLQGPEGPQGPKGDPGSSYSAGTGLGLDGSTLSIVGNYQLPQGCALGQSPFLLGFPLTHPWSCFTPVNAGQNCSAQNYVTGFGPDGSLNCTVVGDDDPVGPDGYVTRHPESQDTPQNTDTIVATLSLPSGSFFVNAHGLANNDPGYVGNSLYLHCWFGPVGFSHAQPYASANSDALGFSLSDVKTLASPGDVTLLCNDSEPHSHVEDVQMTAVQLGSATTQ
jgi:hypothetical protein